MDHLFPIMNMAELTIVPSYTCTSSNCVGCYKKSFGGHSEVHEEITDLAQLILFLRKYVSTLQVHSFGITGGEFTDYAFCSDLVRILTSEFPGISIEIVTNGQNHDRIAEMIEAANKRENMQIHFSIDGFEETCDKLRGKKGYFSKVMMSIKEMARKGLTSCVHIGIRYYPEHEDSIIALSNYLKGTFGIERKAFSLGTVTYRAVNTPDAFCYISKLNSFAQRFWNTPSQINVPNTPSFLIRKQPYDARRWTTLCAPAVQPDGYLCTCDTKHGMRVGHINDDDIIGMVTRLVSVGRLNPNQCDVCQFGQCVLQHYKYHASLERPSGCIE